MALSVQSTFALSRAGAADCRPGLFFSAHNFSESSHIIMDVGTQWAPAYLRLQADRCHRLSRSCMDLGIARDLRLMAEEYAGKASRLETTGFTVQENTSTERNRRQ